MYRPIHLLLFAGMFSLAVASPDAVLGQAQTEKAKAAGTASTTRAAKPKAKEPGDECHARLTSVKWRCVFLKSN